MRRPADPYLLVDGNNIIHAWQELLALHDRKRGLGHAELRRRLRHFHDLSDYRVVVVFDGRAGRAEEEREPGGFHVIYTGGGSTADGVIERLVGKYAAVRRLIVATNDFAEQNLVSSLGAEIWSAETLKAEVEAAEDRWKLGQG